MLTQKEKDALIESGEAKGRALLAMFIEFTNPGVAYEMKENTCNWDAETDKTVMEVKYRYYNHDSFDTWILEKYKYDQMKATGKRCWYFNFFKDGKVIFWSLDAIMHKYEGTEVDKYYKRTTAWDSGGKYKPCYLLKPEDGHILRYRPADKEDFLPDFKRKQK